MLPPFVFSPQAGLGRHPDWAARGLGVQGESSQRAGLRQATWRGHPSEDSDYRLTCLLVGCLGSGFCLLGPLGSYPTSHKLLPFAALKFTPLHSPVLLMPVPLLGPQPFPPPQTPPYSVTPSSTGSPVPFCPQPLPLNHRQQPQSLPWDVKEQKAQGSSVSIKQVDQKGSSCP